MFLPCSVSIFVLMYYCVIVDNSMADTIARTMVLVFTLKFDTAARTIVLVLSV